MKWVVLAIFIALIPMIKAWLTANPKQAPLLWSAFAFLPFVTDSWKTIIAPISWAQWSGYVRGAEISLLDVVALAILISRPARASNKFPLLWLWFMMAFVALMSAIQARYPMASYFVAWQTLRCALIFAAATTIASDPRGPRALMRGMVIGMCLNAGFVIDQKLTGVAQPAGLFRHQNMLGIISHFVAFPALAIAMGQKRSWWLWLGACVTLAVAVLTASRATIGLAGLGVVLVLALSLVRRSTPRKMTVAVVALVGLAAATPWATSILQNRLGPNALKTFDDGERDAFKATAITMMSDHPMGVGANHYVFEANNQGYSQKSGVAWNTGSRSANVHHAYLLVGAEMGYIGFLAFTAFMLIPIGFALRTVWKTQSADADLAVGFTVSLIIVSLHSLYEWAIVTYQGQIFLAIAMGIISALSSKYSRRSAQVRRIRTTIVQTSELNPKIYPPIA